MNFFERVKNFFVEDFSETVGIYYDGFKIYLAHSTHKIEFDEINFELYLNAEDSAIDQLAEKIFMVLNQRGWQNSKIGLCLNDEDVMILKTSFENIPTGEIDSAVKTWANAQTDKNSPYSFIKNEGEIWAETLPQNVINKYISVYEKNSLNLCALTAMPNFSEDSPGNIDRAVFITEILTDKKIPNLLAEKISRYNFKKISLVTAGIFFIAMILISAKLFYDYHAVENEIDILNKNLSAESEILVLKKDSDKNISEMKKINSLIESQADKSLKLNSLIKLGKIPDSSIHFKKIYASNNFVQIEGIANKTDSVEKFLRKLQNSATDAKLENSTTADNGEINFTIKINLE